MIFHVQDRLLREWCVFYAIIRRGVGLSIFIYLNIVEYLHFKHLYVYEDLNGSYK